MSGVKLFGREPAVWVAFLEALVMLAGVQLFDWSQEKVAAVVLVLNCLAGVYTAYVTRDTMLGVLTGLVKAAITCSITFGLDISDDLSAQLIALLTVSVGLFQRTQTSPLADPTFTEDKPEATVEKAAPTPVESQPGPSLGNDRL